MKHSLLVLSLFFSMVTSSQSTFKKGYFVNNDGLRTDAFFMTFGETLSDNLLFKNDKTSHILNEVKTSNISELVIGEMSFQRKLVAFELLDKNMIAKKENNSDSFNQVSSKLLLKKLMSFGEFHLYEYELAGNTYFFMDSKSGIQFLKFKRITKDDRIVPLRKYNSQIKTILPDLTSDLVRVLNKTDYKKEDFIRFFSKYAELKKWDINIYNSYLQRDFKDAFNITLNVGTSFNSQKTSTARDRFQTSLNANHLNFGIETEFLFNSYLKKGSIVLSFAHLSEIEDQGTFSFGSQDDSRTLNKVSQNLISLKYRRYFAFPKKNNQYLFADFGAVIHSSSGSVEYIYNPTEAFIADLDYSVSKNNIGFAIGLGYTRKNLNITVNYIPSLKGTFETFNFNATGDDWVFDRSLLNLTIGYAIF